MGTCWQEMDVLLNAKLKMDLPAKEFLQFANLVET